MTDETIMVAVKNGDLQQTSFLFERYHKRIFNFLAQLSNDREVAEDLTQNVFLRMIRYRNSFRDDSRFTPWIYQIARNVYADHYQMAKKTHKETVDFAKVSDSIPDESDQGVNEKEELLYRSMERLSEEQRELLIMTRFQHMRYEEVAQIMNTSVSNIKVKVHRAIGKLREYYFAQAKM
ncbi:MAG TPA: sigma-70 family RNA polymerase sigma factor [Ohtaekwangia sp.]|nr:sigma-70 family RNA polymerase sigma factor [Ohtaekwangia sp.]